MEALKNAVSVWHFRNFEPINRDLQICDFFFLVIYNFPNTVCLAMKLMDDVLKAKIGQSTKVKKI